MAVKKGREVSDVSNERRGVISFLFFIFAIINPSCHPPYLMV